MILQSTKRIALDTLKIGRSLAAAFFSDTDNPTMAFVFLTGADLQQ